MIVSAWRDRRALPSVTSSDATASSGRRVDAGHERRRPVDPEPVLPELRRRPRPPGSVADEVRPTSGLNDVNDARREHVVRLQRLGRAPASNDAFSDARQDRHHRRRGPSPIIRAAAVEAVRRGLRIAFSRPSLPEIAEPPERRAEAAGDRPGEERRQHGDADERHAPRRARPRRRSFEAGAEQPVEQRGAAERRDDDPDDQPAARRGRGRRGVARLAERLDRRDAGGLARRQERRDHRHDRARSRARR